MRRKRNWTRTLVASAAYAYVIENVQNWRGLDPRFSDIAGPIDQILGGVFFLSALLIMWLFIEMVLAFFSRTTLPDHPLLRTSLQYAAVGAVLAFTVGIVMSIYTNGRTMNGAGNLMPIHAAGFHGLQAVPLVALLLGWSRMGAESAARLVHAAGIGWLLLCAGLVLQAGFGLPPQMPSGALAMSALGMAVWGSVLVYAWRWSAPPAVAFADHE